MISKKPIIARFPPSPTGWFHVGNVRTALFNYFFVKQNGGKLLFRLEDTDKGRSTREYAEDIVAGMKWLGIDIDYDNPYRQSEHGDTYRKHIERLIAEDRAYVSMEEIKEEGQRSEVIRLRNPGQKIVYDDMIRGTIEVDTAELGDFVIAKSLTEPIYHLAVVVDDFEIGVTHVIRGEDGIYNTPRQILIQEAIGAPRPIYAHVPFVLGDDRSKLSKRKHGELVSLKFYRERGYLPEAMVNFLSLCGWNPGGTEEIMSMEQLIEKFDITKVQKSGAIFDQKKLLWFNREYVKRLPKERILSEINAALSTKYKYSSEALARVEPLFSERISTFGEIKNIVASGEFDFLFDEPQPEKESLVWKGDTDFSVSKGHLLSIIKIIESIDENNFKKETIKEAVMTLADQAGRGSVLWPMRVALTAREKSPDPFIVSEIIGKNRSLKRLRNASLL